jgi:hypothetical protein
MAPFKCNSCNTGKYNDKGYYVHSEECKYCIKCEICSNGKHDERCLKLRKWAHFYVNGKLNSICNICKKKFDQKENTLYSLCEDCDKYFWNEVKQKQAQTQFQAQKQSTAYNNNPTNFPPLTSPFADKIKEMELELEITKQKLEKLENAVDKN